MRPARSAVAVGDISDDEDDGRWAPDPPTPSPVPTPAGWVPQWANKREYVLRKARTHVNGPKQRDADHAHAGRWAVPDPMGDVVEQSEGMGFLRDYRTEVLPVSLMHFRDWFRETFLHFLWPLSLPLVLCHGGVRGLHNRSYWPLTEWQGYGQMAVGTCFVVPMLMWALWPDAVQSVRTDMIVTLIIVMVRSFSIGAKYGVRRPYLREAWIASSVDRGTLVDEEIIDGWLKCGVAQMRRHMELAMHMNGVDPATPLVFTGTSLQEVREIMAPALRAFPDIVIGGRAGVDAMKAVVRSSGVPAAAKGGLNVHDLVDAPVTKDDGGSGSATEPDDDGDTSARVGDVIVPLAVVFLRVTLPHLVAQQDFVPPQERYRVYRSALLRSANLTLVAMLGLTPILTRMLVFGADKAFGDGNTALIASILATVPRVGIVANFWGPFLSAALIDIFRRAAWLRTVGLFVAPFDYVPWRAQSTLHRLRLRLDDGLNIVTWARMRALMATEIGFTFKKRNEIFFAAFGVLLAGISVWTLDLTFGDSGGIAATGVEPSSRDVVLLVTVATFAATLVVSIALLFFFAVRANDLAKTHVAYLSLRKSQLWHGAAVRGAQSAQLKGNEAFASAFYASSALGTSFSCVRHSLPQDFDASSPLIMPPERTSADEERATATTMAPRSLLRKRESQAARAMLSTARVSRRLRGNGVRRRDALAPFPAAVAVHNVIVNPTRNLVQLQMQYADAAREIEALDQLDPLSWLGQKVDRQLVSRVFAVLSAVSVLLLRSASISWAATMSPV